MSNRRQAVIRDVAQAAGVSIATVSHALNGKGRMSDATRERVLEVADRMGYRPSPSARSLAGGRTGVLALSLSTPPGLPLSITDFDYFVQLTNGATHAALDAGYALVTLPSGGGRGNPLARLAIDGAVIVDPVSADPSLSFLRERGIPFVTAGREPGGADGLWVDSDHRAATRECLDHLVQAGATRVALVTVPPVISYTQDTLAVYEAWCARRGQSPLVEVAADNPTEAGGYAAAARLLARDDAPDGIYAGLDRLALGVLLAARALGREVPGDLRVVGCTDSGESTTAEPPLTSMNLHPQELGRAAVELLVQAVEGRTPAERHRYVPTNLIVRASSSAGSAASA